MKNQNDLIISIVAGVLMIIAIVISVVTKPEPVKPADPDAVITKKVELPATSVAYTTSLPGGGGSGGAMGGMGGPGGFAGAPTMLGKGKGRPTMNTSGSGGPSGPAGPGRMPPGPGGPKGGGGD